MPSGDGLTCGKVPSLTKAFRHRRLAHDLADVGESLSTIGFGTLAVVVTVCHDAVS